MDEIDQEPVMLSYQSSTERVVQFEVRFQSLLARGRCLAFPCDGMGRVDLDALSERGRCEYLFARAMVDREFARPSVCNA